MAFYCQQPNATAEEGTSVAYGIAFLPLDFYPKHREQLGLSDDQVREMAQIVARMREPGERLQAEIQERAKMLQEAIAENPVNTEQAMERFQLVMQAETEMKSLQFRTRMALRKVLRPEQYDQVRELAVKSNMGREAGPSDAMHEKLRLVREKISKYIGGPLPQELVEKLERIEQLAKKGNMAEAEEHLDALLRSLKGDKESGAANIKEQIQKLEAAAKKTSDSAAQEQIEQQIRRLSEMQESGHADERARSERGGELERQMRRIAEAAERSDNPEVREKLQGALRKLNEAAEAGNPEVVGDILRAVSPLLEGRQAR